MAEWIGIVLLEVLGLQKPHLWELQLSLSSVPVWSQASAHRAPWRAPGPPCDTYSNIWPRTPPEPLLAGRKIGETETKAKLIEFLKLWALPKLVYYLNDYWGSLTLLLAVQITLHRHLTLHLADLRWIHHPLLKLLHLLSGALIVVSCLQTKIRGPISHKCTASVLLYRPPRHWRSASWAAAPACKAWSPESSPLSGCWASGCYGGTPAPERQHKVWY